MCVSVIPVCVFTHPCVIPSPLRLQTQLVRFRAHTHAHDSSAGPWLSLGALLYVVGEFVAAGLYEVDESRLEEKTLLRKNGSKSSFLRAAGMWGDGAFYPRLSSRHGVILWFWIILKPTKDTSIKINGMSQMFLNRLRTIFNWKNCLKWLFRPFQ